MSDLPHWVEDDGTEVWLVGAADRGRIEDLADREASAAASASEGAVFGANADAGDRDRIAQLRDAGYEQVFSIVRLGLPTRLPLTHPLPELEVRTARPGDAAAMHLLTATVWAGRRWFVLPTRDEYEAWLERSDLSLFLLAESEGDLLGYVVGEPRDDLLWIDDVQVHPDHRRRGIATELIARLLDAAELRGLVRAELTTEGGDPAGARTLYESLGFALLSEALRFRRPVR